MKRAESWFNAKNILAIRLDNMGDVLMTTPALRALRDSAPQRRLTLLTSSSGRNAGMYAPMVDQVLIYDAPWMKATANHDSDFDQFTVRMLKSKAFDAAVIFTVYSQNPLAAALLCYLADIPLRLAHCRENPYQLLSDWVIETEPQNGVRHEVQRQLDLVQSVGCTTSNTNLSVEIPPSTRSKLRAQLQQQLDPSLPWVLIHPGATAPARRYPPESFATLTDILANKHGWQIVFSGAADEHALIEEIRRQASVRSFSFAGKLNFIELAALIELAPILISNNTGPVHIAAAVGTPVVDLYALTNPQHQPWKVPHRVLFHDVPCKFCYKSVCPQLHHDCLRKLQPQDVAAATQELAEETLVATQSTLAALTRKIAYLP
ncbi:MAG: glycosyltransferase family 9 protein [Gammaproteobacteria bacterium]|nr:glycosyltransferase family 9 protein [Gammaproteobacteria bacterium]